MRDLARGIDLEPVGRIMALGVGIELRVRPSGQRAPQSFLCRQHTRLAVDRRMAAAEHDFGFPVKAPQKLALPPVPNARADRANVGDGQRNEHLEPLLRLDARRQRLGRARVGDVASLRRVRHDKVVFDQPGDVVGAARGKPEPRAEHARKLGAGARVVARPALGDVVQEGREIKLGPMLDLVDELADERTVALVAARLDVAQRANGADQMLVDRIVVVHRELHHPDDAAEFGNEPAQDAGLVHPPQRGFRRPARGQDFEEKTIRILVVTQPRVDALERLRDEPRRIRMDRQIRTVRNPEDADEIDRVALERVRPDDVDAIIVDLEILGFGDDARPASPQPADQAVEHGRRLGLALLERRADDRRQVADVLRHQEIVLHEALDVGLAGAGGVAKFTGDRSLHVEAQALLGPAGKKMQVAADRPEKLLATAEEREFARREQAGRDEGVRVLHPIDIFRDPEERVEVAQAPLAFLDVGLDEIARRAGALYPLLAFGELGRYEFRRGLGHDLLVEARLQRLEERLIAGDEPRLNQRRPDRHIGARLLQTLVNSPRRVANLLLEVPEHVEQGLDDLLDRRSWLVRHEEQEVDVGARREHAAPVAADRDDRRRRRLGRRPEPTDRQFERHMEQIVDLGAQGFGARPSGPARLERAARLRPAGRECILQFGDRCAAEGGGIGLMRVAKRREVFQKPGAVEPFA